jgi:hypothetical protein
MAEPKEEAVVVQVLVAVQAVVVAEKGVAVEAKEESNLC